MAVANGEHARRITTARVIRFEGLENVPLGKIQTPLLYLNRSIRQLRVGPQQTAQIRGRNSEFVCRLADIYAMTAENFDDNVSVQMLDAVGNDGLAVEVARGDGSISFFSNSAMARRRAAMSERSSAALIGARRSSLRPGRALTRAGLSPFSLAMRSGAVNK